MSAAGALPIAILAGHGRLPILAAAAVARAGRFPLVLAIAGEADPAAFAGMPVHTLRWGEVGRLWRLLDEHRCREAIFIGGVSGRPELRSIKFDMGGIALLPRLAKLVRGGDDALLSGIAAIFNERGIKLVSVLDVAPEMALPAGLLTRRSPAPEEEEDISVAAEAARALGRLDIGQAAVAVGGRVVALEGAEGTNGLLARLDPLRAAGRIPANGGVLVKMVKPQQDRRIDLPTIGPETAKAARAAKLTGVAGSAGETLIAGREETVAEFDRQGLFLTGLPVDPLAEGSAAAKEISARHKA